MYLFRPNHHDKAKKYGVLKVDKHTFKLIYNLITKFRKIFLVTRKF